MKKDIHPEYYETTVTCACGEVINTRSTKKNIRVEICSKCHPFYTGKQKFVDSAGRVDRFKKKYNLWYSLSLANKGQKQVLSKASLEEKENAKENF